MFYDTLINLCNKHNVKITPLVVSLGGSSSSPASWKKGTSPNSDIVIKLAEYFNVSTDYLLLDKEPTIPTEYKKLISSYKMLSPDNQRMALSLLETMYNVQTENEKQSEIKLTTISRSLHKVSAGLGEALDDPDNWEDISVPESDIVDKADYALRISGDSMEPKFFDDETVLIKQQDAVDIGDICIYIIEGAGYIKKFGGDRLISLNDEYDDILFAKYNPDDIKCRGLVLGKVDVY